MRHTQRRKVYTVHLIVRPRGTTERHSRLAFKAYATSPHHAELMARAFAEKNYEVAHPH